MLPSNVIKFVKKRKDAEKIVQVFDGYTKKVKYPSIEVHQNMLLCLAVEHNHLQLVKLLARRGADVNFHEKHPSPAPLHVACQIGNPELIYLLLDLGADVQMVATCIVPVHRDPLVNPNARGIPKTAMEVVLYHDDPSLMALLLPHYDVNKELERQSVLHLAAKTGAYECVLYLLGQKETKVNEVDAAGRSPLYYAVQHEARLVELLLNYGSDPNLVTLSTKREKGSTALHHLAELPKYSSLTNSNLSSLQSGEFLVKLRLLLASGGNVSHVLTDGHSPMSLLCCHAVNLIGNHLRNQDVDMGLIKIITDTICQAVSILLQHGARTETKHGLNAFRTLLGESKKWFARIHHSYMLKTSEQKQNVLKTVTNVLQFVLKVTEIMMKHQSTELKVVDLRFVLSTKTAGHGKYGVRRADLKDLEWTVFESVYSEIARLAILATDFKTESSDIMEDKDDFVDIASFPSVLEKIINVLPANIYSEVIARLENIEEDKNNIDTSNVKLFLSCLEGRNIMSLKGSCRCVIFHCLNKSRSRSIESLALPESIKKYLALEY